MRVNQIMTPDVITVGADTTIVEAANTMLRYHIGALPVVDAAGRLIGIISEGDFIRRAEIGTQHKRGRWLSFLAGADRIATEFAHERGRKVGEIMTPDPLTVTEDTPLERIVQIMQSSRVKRIPVMRGDRMVGIVTLRTFLPRSPALPAAFRIRPRETTEFAVTSWPLSGRLRGGLAGLTSLSTTES